MTLTEFEHLSAEVVQLKIDLFELRNKIIAEENNALRLRMKTNAQTRRNNKAEIKRLRKELQPDLPF